MKRINNRGAILLETLIVSVFIMTIFVLVYRNTVPLMGEYQKLENFDDVDSVYAANLIKNMVVTYVSSERIETLLGTNSYYDISNCDQVIEGISLYDDSNYCKTLKNNLHIEDDDIMYITRYDETGLNNFKNTIKNNSYFNGGSLGNFVNYLDTVTSNESFYNPNDENKKLEGKYRIFISRTVTMMDGTTIKKYSNIGVYKNNYTGEQS